MVKAKIAPEKQELPGLAFDRFKAAADAVAELRDNGKALIFLNRSGKARILGLPPFTGEFHELLSKHLQGPAPDSSETQYALKEIEQIVSVLLASPDEKTAATRLLYHLLAEFGRASEFDPAAPAHDHVLKKVQAASRLVTDALKQRRLRLQSASVACLEDVDAELVQERQDRLGGTHVDIPFLRLRLRYSERAGPSFDMIPFMLAGSDSPKAFEIECDLSDLDLLQTRIDNARQLLRDASTSKEEVRDDTKS